MRNYQSGQILLIVILGMVIALTVGLSVATRTITNIRTSTDEENSERAFSAAEAGIEQALTSNTTLSGSFSNSATYTTTVNQVSGLDYVLNSASPVLKDAPVDVWFSTYPNYTNPWTGTATVYWGNSSDSCTTDESTNTMAALEIIVISGTKASPVLTRYVVDPCSARASINKFEYVLPASGTVSGKSFAYRKSFSVTSGLIARIIPLYSSTTIGIRGCNAAGTLCNALPVQGTRIESIGTSNDTQRKIVTFKGYPSLPNELFPFVIFAPK